LVDAPRKHTRRYSSGKKADDGRGISGAAITFEFPGNGHKNNDLK
jgi:hypothetical protein